MASMKPIFANPTPVDYSYDSGVNVLYLTFAHQKAVRAFEVLADWPMILVDTNAEGQIIGIEYAGGKQFGVETFMRLLRERVRSIGVETAEEADCI